MENNNQKNPELQTSESNEQEGQVLSQAAGQTDTSIRSDIAHYGFIMLICALMIGIYHVSFNKKPQQNIAVVDLTDIVSIKQKQFTNLITKKNATDADRGAAYEMVKAFGPSLEKSLVEVQKDCNCTLVSKQAILAGNLEDKTADLKARLGLK